MPTTDKNKIGPRLVRHFIDKESGLYRSYGTFTTSYYETGIVSGKTFEFFAKDINTDTYVKVNDKSSDDLDYYSSVYDGNTYINPVYTDDEPALSSAGMSISRLYPDRNGKEHISNSESDYYSIQTNFNAELRFYTAVSFVIVFVPWRHEFYVNTYSQASPLSFKDMEIRSINNGGQYQVLVKKPNAILDHQPEKMYGDNDSFIDAIGNYFYINSETDNNVTFGFEPIWDITPNCDNETNAARYIGWNSYVNVQFKKFDKPIININKDRITWTVSQYENVQNGYAVYFDNQYYSTQKNSVIEIPDQYKLGKHTISVKVLANSKTTNLGDREIKWRETPKGNVVDYTKETAIAFTDSDISNMTYVGEVSVPTKISEERIKVNQYRITWSQVEFTDGYHVYLDDSLVENQATSITVNVSQGEHNIKVFAYKNVNGVEYKSEPLIVNFYMNKVESPTNITFTKNRADGGLVYWKQVSDAESFDDVKEYTLQVNGIEYHTNGNTYNLTDLPIGTSELYIKANFGPDTTYNSDYRQYKFTNDNIIKRLSNPVMSADKMRNPDTNGVEALKLSWKPVSYASGYVLDDYYEVFNDESGLWEGTHIEDDLIATEKIIKFNIGQGVGKHTYKVKAYYKELENDFTSDYSNIPPDAILEVSKLKPLKGLKWKSTDTHKQRDESTIRWSPVDDENYYRVFALKDGESGDLDSKGYVIRTDGSSQYNFDLLNMSVVNSQLNTALYDIYLRCYNYDTLYYQPSEISNRLTYRVIQLDAPSGLTFNKDTLTLSWNKVNMATSYILYKVGEPRPITETSDTQYTFPELGNGLFKFYVIAKRTVMEEE